MVNNGSDDIVELILQSAPGLTREELLRLIEEKRKELGGLIDRDAAAILVARDLGIPLPKERVVVKTARLRIRDLVAGLRNVTLLARVLQVSTPFRIVRENGEVTYVRILLGDDTGTVNLVIWNEDISKAEDLRPGDCVMVEGAYVRKFRGSLELGLSRDGSIKRVDDNLCREIPCLEELIDVHGVGSLVVSCSRVYETHEGLVCIVGTVKGGKRAYVVLGREVAMPEPGDLVVVQNVKLAERGDCILAYASRFSRLFKIGSGKVAPPRVLTVDEYVAGGSSSIVSIRGFLLAAVPSKRMPCTLYVGSDKQFVRVKVFDVRESSSIFEVLSSVKTGSSVEILGLEVLSDGSLKFGRLSGLQRLEEGALWRGSPRDAYIIDAEGYVRVTAALVDVEVRVSPKHPLVGLRARIDDGTGQLVMVTKERGVIEAITGISSEEIAEYEELGILDSLLEHLKGEILGHDVLIEGWAYKGRLIIPRRISPV